MTDNRVQTRRERALVVLAGGGTQAEAAAAANVSERTIRRWLASPDFLAKLRQTTDEHLGQAMRELAAGTRGALAVIANIMGDGELSPSVRLRATQLWLEAVWKAREQYELTERVTELEQRLGGEGTCD